MVRHELKRNDRQQRRETLLRFRDLNGVIRYLGDHFVAFGHHGNHSTLPGFDLLDVGDHFFVRTTMRRNDYHRHFLRDEGDRSMFHLRRGIAFGMDIRDLLQFERALQCNRVIIPASEINEILGVRESLGEIRNAFVLGQHALDLVGDLTQFADDPQVLVGRQRSFLASDTEREHGKCYHLRREGFGGSDTDLRSHMGVTAAIAQTRDRRPDDITDREDERSFGLSELDCRQRVCCLARLRDGNDHIVLVDDRLAIAELRRILDFHRYLRELFDGVHSDQAGVPRSAASGDDNSLGVQETVFIIDESGEGDIVLAYVDASAHGVRQRARLLEDFLEHEMRVAAFFQLAQRELQSLDLRGLFNVVDGSNIEEPLPLPSF